MRHVTQLEILARAYQGAIVRGDVADAVFALGLLIDEAEARRKMHAGDDIATRIMALHDATVAQLRAAVEGGAS